MKMRDTFGAIHILHKRLWRDMRVKFGILHTFIIKSAEAGEKGEKFSKFAYVIYEWSHLKQQFSMI